MISQQPQLYWVTAANHKNFSDEDYSMRDKFNTCLDTVVKLYDNMCMVKLREYWFFHNDELVTYNSMTRQGISAYWKSIDAAVAFNIRKNQEFQVRRAFQGLRNKRETPNRASQGQGQGQDARIFIKRKKQGGKSGGKPAFKHRRRDDETDDNNGTGGFPSAPKYVNARL